MTSKFSTAILLFFSIVIGISSCKDKPHFTIKGKIVGAADTTVYLYKRGITGADLVDSAKTGKDARFEIKSASPQYPDLYILALGKQMINLAVDSIETIEITANAKNFATSYQVKGSVQSDLIRKMYLKQIEVTKTLNELKSKYDKKEMVDSTYLNQVRKTTAEFQEMSIQIILNNMRDLSAYYALFQQVDGHPLFNPLLKSDSRFFGAVATAWDTYRTNSPRAEHLKNYTLNTIARRRAMEGETATNNQQVKTTEASDFFNISLPGLDERNIDLKSLRGKVVLLDFTVYQDENAPAHNVLLNKVYQKFKNSGFSIYQVSFNTPLHFWRTAASNLPWVCVREDNADSDLPSRFNFQSLPTMFLINKQGDIVKRIDPKEDIAEQVQKVL